MKDLPGFQDIGEKVKPAVTDHTLIRCVGRGSYGEVWLARSVLGTYRAVKILYRAAFSDAKPFERELRGIRAYEPVSRSHEGLVDVLHVGEGPGYFYYVMELADDCASGQEVSPDTYTPKTIATELNVRGSLSVDESVRIGLLLASALSHLHKHRLVHRDVKPSNIIFVGGSPKLADIGLVAEATEARSYVGTEGFIPLEGPGTPQADIYGLGKVLYEMGMGKDRMEYPSLPTLFEQHPERDKLAELNEIISRACENKPADRYKQAEDLRNDLALFQGGESVRRLRILEKRWAVAWKTTLALVLVTAVIGGVFLQLRVNHRREVETRRQRADSYVTYGTRLMREGNLVASLPWLAEALRLDQEDAARAQTHRVRIAAIANQIPQLTRLWPTEGSANFVQFSPDGSLLASADMSGAIRVWRVSDGQPAAPLIYHSKGKGAGSVSFSPDGNVLLTTGSDNCARRWHLSDGAELLPALEHDFEVHSAEFSPDGRQIVTASAGSIATVWEVSSMRPIVKFRGHSDQIRWVSFCPGGEKVISSSQDHSAWIWKAATGEPGPRIWHKSWVYSARFSPDGESVATAGFDHIAQLWEVKSGAPLSHPFSHEGGVTALEFSPDGRYVATACFDSRVYLWDTLHGKWASSPLELAGQATDVSFNPTGQFLATASCDEGVRLWNLSAFNWLPNAVEGTFSSDGTRRVSIKGLAVEVHDLKRKDTVRIAADAEVTGVVLNRTGDHLLLETKEDEGRSMVRLAETRSGRLYPPISRRKTNSETWKIDTTGTKALILSNQKIEVWDLNTDTLFGPPLVHPETVKGIAASSGTTLVAWAGRHVYRWNTATGRLLGPSLEHPCNVSYATLSNDEEILVTCCADWAIKRRFARLWRVTTGEPVGVPLEHRDGVVFAAFSPDDALLVTASEDATARIWDVASALPRTAPLQHEKHVFQAQFSPDARWVVTASRDGSARIWDAATGEPVTPPLKHPGEVRSAQFLVDRSGILSVGSSGQFIWDLEEDHRTVGEIQTWAESLAGVQMKPGGKVSPSAQVASTAWPRIGSASRIEPHALDWHVTQARLCEHEGRHFATRFHLNAILELGHDNASLRMNRGEANAELGNWREAAIDFTRAIELGASNKTILCYLPRLWLAAGEEEKCVRALKRISLSEAAVADDEIAWLHSVLPSMLSEDFIKHYSSVAGATINETPPQIAGALCYRLGKYDAAIESLLPAARQRGENASPEVWLFLAMAEYRKGNVEKALERLTMSRQWIDLATPSSTGSRSHYQVDWKRRADLVILRREAERMVADSSNLIEADID